MPEELKEKKVTLSKAVASQLLRGVGASLLGVAALIEHYALESGVDIREISSITSSMRRLCTALIKVNIESIESTSDELENALNQAQAKRLNKSAETVGLKK